MKFDYAVTRPINESPSPILTINQVWQGLKMKARDPVRFIPGVGSCEVVKESETGLTRLIEFKAGLGPQGKITEEVTFTPGVRADFLMPESGTAISNIISIGEDETDLYLTFTFAWKFPNIPEGSEEAAARVEQMKKIAQTAVPQSIKEIRELVKQGDIA